MFKKPKETSRTPPPGLDPLIHKEHFQYEFQKKHKKTSVNVLMSKMFLIKKCIWDICNLKSFSCVSKISENSHRILAFKVSFSASFRV